MGVKMIKIAAKSTPNEEGLKRTGQKIIRPLKENGVNVLAHEIFLGTEFSVDDKKERYKKLEEFCIKNDIEEIICHPPIISDDRFLDKFDLANPKSKLREICMNCLYELSEMDFVEKTHLVVHTLGMTTNIGNEKKDELLSNTIDALKEMKKISKSLICIENNPSDFQSFKMDGTLGMHPKEIEMIVEKTGIKACLDFAHFQIFYESMLNMEKNAIREKNRYGEISWDGAIEIYSKIIGGAHINDAKGTTVEYEGIEVGKGNVPFEKIIPKIAKKEIFGTFEIINLHLEPEVMINSVLKIKEIFKDDFYKYFYS